MRDLETLLPGLLNLCGQAGDRICEHYHSPEAGQYQSKGDDSPLTRADLDSHDILCAGLAELLPGVPLLSEESSETDRARRREWGDFWLVDPLDGTKEFLSRTGEFTINVALVSAHRPVLGIIYLPLEKRAYVGIPGRLARRYDQAADAGWRWHALAVRPLQAGQPLTLLASSRHRGPRLQACLDWLDCNWGAIERLDSGSALKFCQLAEAEGDFYPRFSPCCEWDTAAGQALVEAAGGCVLGMDGQPLRYNCSDSLYSPDFYALADADNHLWRDLLETTPTFTANQ